MGADKVRAIAFIMVRDGGPYVEHCLTHLVKQGLEVAVLDHDSTDATYAICENWLDKGVCCLQHVPYRGHFSLREQLLLKQDLIRRLNPGWAVHQDIDECLEPPVGFSSLYEWIEVAEKENFNALNFNEFVFIPHVAANEPFYNSRHYYFFSPWSPRLMRGWKCSAELSALETGGHVLKGDLRLFPDAGYLRHYLFLDQAHAYRKYGRRSFDASEVAQGWHRNRLDIPREALHFPEKSRLEYLPSLGSKAFNTHNPWKKHYWQMTK
ncbi:MAG: glycosyltransferase family 2 protein [Thiothrix sp.]|nr:glycosyltransferase family 2 protein [Thiothrix sp.]HPQ94076.1 glycosyltransferase family 2 protein [Thiolinea sp.]